jgi:hypothetical protein
MTNSKKADKSRRSSRSSVLIYHVMVIEENFERSAYRLLELVKDAQRTSPGANRVLYLDIDGHRNAVGGFDRDSYELMTDFISKVIFPFLTEYDNPFFRVKNSNKQRNDVPESVVIQALPAEDDSFDVHNLRLRSREREPELRSSPPSVRAIADYIGISPPRCLICRRGPVERAHAAPRSLQGSYDIRNFALLCPDHHRQSPDIADAEAFWAWIDYMMMRNSNSDYSADHPRMLGVRAPDIEGSADDRSSFNEALNRELIELYGWRDDEFSAVTWQFLLEFNKVLEDATGSHFGVSKKPSTYAWAYDVALRRIGKKPPPYYPIY